MEIDAISKVISLKITTSTVSLFPAFIVFLARVSGRQHVFIQSTCIPPDNGIPHRALQTITSSQTFYLLICVGVPLTCSSGKSLKDQRIFHLVLSSVPVE